MDKEMTKIVVEIPMDTYFKLKEKAKPLTVKQYVELLLNSVDRLSKQRGKVLEEVLNERKD